MRKGATGSSELLESEALDILISRIISRIPAFMLHWIAMIRHPMAFYGPIEAGHHHLGKRVRN
jgi:hypothetical protein